MATAKTPKAPAKTAALKKDTGTASTAVAVRKPAAGAVVDIREQLRQQAQAMGSRTQAPGGNRITIGQDKTFRLPDGSKVQQIDVVIVDFVTTHSFFERPFDPKNITPPGCYAVGANPREMAPVAESPNKQAEDCQVCPMNEFGSAGDGKACKNARLLAVLPVTEDGTDVDHEEDMLLIGVSPTALKAFDGYVQSIARTFQLPPVGVITTLSFDPNVTYSRLQFSDPRPVNSLGEAYARQAEAKELLNALPDFSGWEPVAPPKGRAAAGARR